VDLTVEQWREARRPALDGFSLMASAEILFCATEVVF
jgi:hypothetical protein